MRRLFLTAWIIWVCDFLTKIWALGALSSTPRPILGDFLQLTLVKNSGAAFSFAAGYNFIFTLLAVSVVVAILYYSPRVTSTGWLITVGLLLGGVLGNLTDRIFREPGFLNGHVVDWIELPRWPVFNIADSAITIAAVMAFTLTVRNIPPVTRVR